MGKQNLIKQSRTALVIVAASVFDRLISSSGSSYTKNLSSTHLMHIDNYSLLLTLEASSAMTENH